MKDRKTNLKGIPARDLCMTPGYALEPLDQAIKYYFQDTIWEPAAGSGLLVRAIQENHWYWCSKVVATDISNGPEEDFFTIRHPLGDAIITNPPFSIRGKFTDRALGFCKRVALLMPTETVSLAWFHKTVEKYSDTHGQPGIVWFSPRVNFKMPNKAWAGSGSQFPCAWFTWGYFEGQRFYRMEHWTKDYREMFEI